MLIIPKLLALFCLAAFLSSCASILNGAEQLLTFKVTCKGRSYPVFCEAQNAKGNWQFVTPQTKAILRDSSPLKITCNSPSFGEFSVRALPRLSPVIAGNLVSGGLAGAIIDGASSSMWMYPSSVSIENEFCTRFLR